MNKKSFLVILLLLLSTCKIAFATYGGVTLSAWTDNPPTIDGEPQPFEWDDADSVDFSTDNSPPFNGTIWVMNDADNLYIFIEFEYEGSHGSLKIYFDNDNDEDEWDPDDDGLCFEWGPTEDNFTDIHFSGWDPDTSQDGEGNSTSSPGYKYVEFSHPLNSGDPEDFSLMIGDTVGFQINTVFGDSGYWPPKAQTTNDILIAGPPEPVGGVILPNVPLRSYSILILLSVAAIFTIYRKNEIIYQNL
jgi:hypothetical protein